MLSTEEIIARYYVGYYNRAPDPAGFEFWKNAYENGTSTLEIANFFSDQVETRALYPFFGDPGVSSPTQFITSVYQNLFNRDPDPDGLAFWEGQLSSGGVSTGQMIEAIIEGALTNPDLAVVQNKVATGIYWEDQANNYVDFDYSQQAAQSATNVLQVITDDTGTIGTAQATANAFFATLPNTKINPGDELTDDGNDDDKVDLGSISTFSETDALDQQIGILTNDADDVINLDAFRADARFSDIDGQGVTVVVIDTGIDLNHPAFGPDTDNNGVADRIIFARDFTDEGDGTPDDVQSHGSHVASIVGSSNDAYLGVAPGVNIVALQALNNQGSGTTRQIESAVQWVVQNAEALNIVAVNMSLGNGENVNQISTHPVYGDELRVLHDQLGVTTIVAAGNDYETYQSEGASPLSADPHTIAIGAVGGNTQSGNDIVSFSQRSDDIPTVFAPGAGIQAAIPGGGSGQKSGTSMASPHVAGMVALSQQLAQRELGRFLTPDEFETLLAQSATRFVDDEDPFDFVRNTGQDYGRVDMLALGEAILQLGGDGGGGGGGTPTPPPTDGDTIPDSIDTGATLAVGNSTQSSIDFSGDLDYFAINLTPGTYEFALKGSATGNGSLSDPLLTLLNSSGGFVASNDDDGTTLNSLIEFTVSNADTYFLSAGAYGTAVGSYELSATQTGSGSGEVGDTPSTAGSIGVGQSLSNELEFGADRDWFAIELNAGETYVFDLVGGTLSDPFVYLYSESGGVLASNDDGGDGFNSQLNYTADRSGTHYISAEAYASDQTGTYTLTTASLGNGGGGGDDRGDGPGNAGLVLADGGVTSGSLEQLGDDDWFRVDVQGNTTYEFALTGTGGTSGLRDPFLYLYDASGALIGSDDDSGGGLNSLITYSTISDHTVYLSAEAFAGRSTGDYTVSSTVTSRSQQDIPDNTSTTAVLTVDEALGGTLEEVEDRDWYAVNVVAGQTYTFDVTSAGDSPISDPYVALYSNTGSFIDLNDDGGDGRNAQLIYEADSTGRVYVEASSFLRTTETGTYQISASTQTSTVTDPGDNIFTTATIAPGQTARGAIDQPGDFDWYALEVVAGQSYQIDLTSAGGDPVPDPYLRVYNGDGSFALEDDDSGSGLNSQLIVTINSSGTIYVSAEAFDTEFETGSYDLSVSNAFASSQVALTGISGISEYDG